MADMPVNLQRRALFTIGSAVKNTTAVPLPWLKQPALFTAQCTRCNACIEHCPEQIVQRGDGGFPRIDFQLGECTFCGECTRHCPEHLFAPPAGRPWLARLDIDTRNCLPHRQVVCQSCRDACGESAIRFSPSLGRAAVPQVDADACTGCGACLTTCPVGAIQLTLEAANGG